MHDLIAKKKAEGSKTKRIKNRARHICTNSLSFIVN